MDRSYVEDNQLVEKYLSGKLPADVRADFEAFILDKPDLLEHLEIETILATGIQEVDPANRSFTRTGNSQPAARWLPIAAVFAFVAFGGSLIANVLQVKRTASLTNELLLSRSAQANVPLLDLEQERAGDSPSNKNKELTINEEARIAVLNVRLSFPEMPSYEVKVLTHPARDLVVEFGAVRPKGTGDFVLALPRELLEDGDYIVEVSSGSKEIAAIPFKVLVAN